jgi:hypothetical protein
MKTVKSAGLVLAGLVGLGLAAQAADSVKVVIRLKGIVQSSVDNQVSWQPIFGQRILKQGDVARTLVDSQARVQTADGSQLILGPNTVAIMSELDKGANRLKVRVESGGVRAKVSKVFSQGRFELDTRNGVLAARGTDYAVWYASPLAPTAMAGPELPGMGLLATDKDEMKVLCAVFEGTVSVGDAILHPGDMAVVGAGGAVQVNPPDLDPGSVPIQLKPTVDPGAPPPVETSTYLEGAPPGSALPPTTFTELNNKLLTPTEGGTLAPPGTTTTTTSTSGTTTGSNPAAPSTPVVPTGRVQIRVTF